VNCLIRSSQATHATRGILVLEETKYIYLINIFLEHVLEHDTFKVFVKLQVCFSYALY